MKYYVVKYAGPFGFIKPWTAVRDASGGETYSQQFLTPSIIEGIRQKLEVTAIMRHKLSYAGINIQQEVVQAKAWSKKGKTFMRARSVLKRGVMLSPVILLLLHLRMPVKQVCNIFVYVEMKKVLNKKEIQEKHFDWKLNKCLLNQTGKKIFVKAIEDKLIETIKHRILNRNVSYRHLIKLECYKLAKHLLEIEEYKPFKMYW